jgi:large subunit ribosomal protein L24
MLVDPQTEERTRVRRKQLEDGTRIRIAAKSGEQIPDAS